MPRAQKPFKSFYSSRYVFAVQLTAENIDEVARKIGGRVRETDEGLVLRFPSSEFVEDQIATPGQYIVVTDIDEAGKYSIGVRDEEDFEQDWTVPNGILQTRAKEAHDKEQAEKTEVAE